jgi:peptidoglycan/LPS O-acetylase OafA/YrhL
VYIAQIGPLTWLFCLPIWLLGVLIAERFTLVRLPMDRLWFWRAGALLHGMLANILIYHSPIVVGLVWTIPPFAIYCFFWLRLELAHLRASASRALEALGKASYSIYLTHKLPITFTDAHLLGLGAVARWGVQLGLLISFAGLFYWLVEWPSHWLARRVRMRRVD